MGILDTSYYGWSDVKKFQPNENVVSASYYDIHKSDTTNDVYIAGEYDIGSQTRWLVEKCTEDFDNCNIDDDYKLPQSGSARAVSIDVSGTVYVSGDQVITGSTTRDTLIRRKNNNVWNTVHHAINDVSNDSDVSGSSVFVCSHDTSNRAKVLSSSNGSEWGEADSYSSAENNAESRSIVVSPSGLLYYCGAEYTVGTVTSGWFVRKSSDGGSSWSEVDSFQTSLAIGVPSVAYVNYPDSIVSDSNNNIYIIGSSGSEDAINQNYKIVRKSSDNGSTWTNVFSSASVGNIQVPAGSPSSITIDSNDSVYILIQSGSDSYIKKSLDAGSTWVSVDTFSNYQYHSISAIDYEDQLNSSLFLIGKKDNKIAVVTRGSLTANSASLGEKMLNTSFGYVFSELSGTTTEKFKLNNISEFPHSSGLFQMKNMVLGTTTSGKVGKNIEENIITVNHVGSFVQIMWPKQDDVDANVKGFGDLSAGQKIGKLTTNWSPGEFFDVTEFDHLTLWNYVLKNSSGSLDDVQIRIERRPLRSTGFTVEQGIEDSISGSYTVSKYRDHIHEKEINYGDLSIKEISWPIDIDLENTKELRISVKHKIGQSSEDNKNFISYGRFINSEEET